MSMPKVSSHISVHKLEKEQLPIDNRKKVKVKVNVVSREEEEERMLDAWGQLECPREKERTEIGIGIVNTAAVDKLELDIPGATYPNKVNAMKVLQELVETMPSMDHDGLWEMGRDSLPPNPRQEVPKWSDLFNSRGKTLDLLKRLVGGEEAARICSRESNNGRLVTEAIRLWNQKYGKQYHEMP